MDSWKGVVVSSGDSSRIELAGQEVTRRRSCFAANSLELVAAASRQIRIRSSHRWQDGSVRNRQTHRWLGSGIAVKAQQGDLGGRIHPKIAPR